MALNEVGLLVYSQGFAISRDEYIIRELAFCDWTGHHHALFKYLLPMGVSYNQLSEEAKTRVKRQTRTVHGLPFEPYTAYNRHAFHPYHYIKDDITRFHGERESGVWHDHCVQVRACQMSGWLRRQTNVLPTHFQVNAQRVLWQKRCDRLMNHLLCNHCKEEKDEAFARGQALDWIPDNCNECSTVRRIFEQTVTCREWQTPMLYADDEPHTMWAWNPLSHHKHCF